MNENEIRLRVREIAESRGIQNANQLATYVQKVTKGNNKLAPMVARRLWHGELGEMDLGVLSALCRAFAAEPGDFLAFGQGRKSRTVK
jgi:DNA-binding Xre family transcriptional regulator